MNKKPVIGKLLAPFALKGGVKAKSYSGETEHFRALINEEIELKKGSIILRAEVNDVEIKGETPVLFFTGYPTPESAKELSGYEIVVDRSLAAPLEDGEYYVSDLMGLTLVFAGKPIGTVTAYLEAATLILEIKLKERSTYAFIPFIAKYIGRIDLEKGTVELLDDSALSPEPE